MDATAVVEAQTRTAMSLAEARTIRDGRDISRLSMAPSLNSRPKVQLTTNPTPSSMAIAVACPVVLVSASHPSPWTSGRTLSAIWLDPEDSAAATNPAAIAGTASAGDLFSDRVLGYSMDSWMKPSALSPPFASL